MLTLYDFNEIMYNPAAGGFDDLRKISLVSKRQWLSVPGAGFTFAGSYDQAVRSMHGGFGVVAVHDEYNILQLNQLGGSYHYRVDLADEMQLRIGGQVTASISSINLTGAQSNSFGIDLGAGAHFKWKDYYAGISAQHLNSPSYDHSLVAGTIEYKPTLFVNTGYRWQFNEGLELHPSVLARVNNGDAIVDMKVMSRIWELLYAGAGYRTNGNRILVCAGFSLAGWFDFILAYDSPNENFGSNVEGTIRAKF